MKMAFLDDIKVCNLNGNEFQNPISYIRSGFKHWYLISYIRYNQSTCAMNNIVILIIIILIIFTIYDL